jgi:hypothetical protein
MMHVHPRAQRYALKCTLSPRSIQNASNRQTDRQTAAAAAAVAFRRPDLRRSLLRQLSEPVLPLVQRVDLIEPRHLHHVDF